MTIKQLEYVLAVAENGSLSQASAKLYVSQPALSETIRNLEEEIGFDIFSRSHSGMILTVQGESFLSDAQSLLEHVRYMEDRYEPRFRKQHYFSVSSTHFYFAQSALAQLSRETEGSYTLRCLDGRKLEVMEQVARGVSELGILNYREDNRVKTLRELRNRKLEHTVLRSCQPAAFLADTHPLAGRESVTTQDLRAYPCSTFYQSSPLGPLVSAELSTEWFPQDAWDRELVVQDCGTINVFLRETLCFSVGSGVVPPCFRAFGITAVPVVDLPKNTILWIHQRHQELSPLAQRYLELCNLELGSGGTR